MANEKIEPARSPLSVVQIAACLIIVALLMVVLHVLGPLLRPLFIAIFFFYIGAPLTRWLIEHKVPSFVANLVLILVAVAILFVIGWVVGTHVDDLRDKFPHYRNQFITLFGHVAAWIGGNVPAIGDRAQALLSKQKIPLAPLEGIIKALVGNFFSFLSTSVIVLVYLIFISGEAITLPKRLESAYGKLKADRILDVGRRINRGIIKYVYVKGIASLLVSLLSTCALLIFHVDLAIVWGTLFFFGNFIPYLGSAIALLFPIVISLLQFGNPALTIVLALLLLAFQILVGNYFEPKFAGQQLNLSPLVVIISLAFWGWLWGMVGLLLSIPIMVSLRFVLENIPATREVATIISHVSKKDRH